MSSWNRLDQVIKHYNFTTNSFSKRLGLKRAESLYQIKRGNYSISKKLASLISSNFPEISESWLLTGDGSMFVKEENAAKKIPIYNISASNFNQEVLLQEDVAQMEIPLLSHCDFALFNNGDAMSPEILPGSVVILETIEKDAVISGEIFLVVSEHFSVIRFVRNYGADSWKLVSKNTQDYDEIVVKKSEVKAIYKVKGVLSMFSM